MPRYMEEETVADQEEAEVIGSLQLLPDHSRKENSNGSMRMNLGENSSR
ncbi:hypothetical protein AKJ16_DCAP17554 [Drosera capensis]